MQAQSKHRAGGRAGLSVQLQSLRLAEQAVKKQVTEQTRLLENDQQALQLLEQQQQAVSAELAAMQMQVPELAAITARYYTCLI